MDKQYVHFQSNNVLFYINNVFIFVRLQRKDTALCWEDET